MNKKSKITTGKIYKLIRAYKYGVLCNKCKADICGPEAKKLGDCLINRQNYDKNLARYIVKKLK